MSFHWEGVNVQADRLVKYALQQISILEPATFAILALKFVVMSHDEHDHMASGPILSLRRICR
jgi:hypothetical protein